MFVCQISKLEVGGILQECSWKRIGNKLFLFLPKFWSNLTFYLAKGFSRIRVYLNFKPPAFDMQMKLDGFTKLIHTKTHQIKNTSKHM